ncbi:MAG: nucleoside-diphosphate sugar epimerase/dehydratase [Candidatus Hodarchaeota archaeon]
MVDISLVLGSVVAGYYLRFGWDGYPRLLHHVLARGFFFVLVFQISLYYFELYELKIIGRTSKFSFRFVQSIAATLAVLMISYYMFPNLYLGRGVLFFTVSCATAGTFFWRIVYRSMVKGSQLNERVVILGTGGFAGEIARQIRDKKDSGFEVIGHIDEQKRE